MRGSVQAMASLALCFGTVLCYGCSIPLLFAFIGYINEFLPFKDEGVKGHIDHSLYAYSGTTAF